MALVHPTKGETLQIYRLRSGKRQPHMASDMGVGVDIYRGWEADVGDCPEVVLSGPPEPRELCRILRKRAKQTQRQLAAKMGVSTLWVLRMENGSAPVDQLASFWGLA